MTLQDLDTLQIDWNLGPEDAVTLYLEWGNNNWHAEHPPVRSKDDYAIYFVMDNWQYPPTLRLVKRNSEDAIDLLTMRLPENLETNFCTEFKGLKGVFAPTPEIKEWLKKEIYA